MTAPSEPVLCAYVYPPDRTCSRLENSEYHAPHYGKGHIEGFCSHHAFVPPTPKEVRE